MNLPENVSQTALFERIEKIYGAALQNNVQIPEYVIEHIKKIISGLKESQPDLEKISSSAHGILRWYFDQGFKEIPVHAALSRFALDIVKMRDIVKTLPQIEQLLSGQDTPNNPRETVNILKNMLAIFASDGGMDEERYIKLSIQLNELCKHNKEVLEKSVDPVIFHI